MAGLYWRQRTLLILSLSAVACGSNSPAPSPVPSGQAVPRGGVVDVSGRVIDFATNSGVPNAVVTFARYEGNCGTANFIDHVARADVSGFYRLILPSGTYCIAVNGQVADLLNLLDRVYRGDVLVRAGGCSARYGMVVDDRTRRPIEGVRVMLVGFETVTDAAGWYRLDMGCGSYGIGTTFISFARPAYADLAMVAGRRESLAGLRRMDAALHRH